MYASLDRIDIVTQRDGRKEYWQTDHRDADEIEKQRALSILLALTKILNPRRGVASRQPGPVMVYSAMYPPRISFCRRCARPAPFSPWGTTWTRSRFPGRRRNRGSAGRSWAG